MNQPSEREKAEPASIDDLAQEQQRLIDLLSHIALGDQAAFAQLYTLTNGALFGFACRFTPDEHTASEILQESYIKIWRQAHLYRPHLAKPMTWMITIVRNHSIDMLRKKKLTIDDTPVDDMISIIDEQQQSPLDASIENDQLTQLHYCLGQLSDDQRRSVLLAYYQGLSHEELSLKLGSPIGTIKSWVRRGVQKLQSCLGLHDNEKQE